MEKLRIFVSKSSLFVLLIIAVFLSGCDATNVQATPVPICEPTDASHIYRNDDYLNKSPAYIKRAQEIYEYAFNTGNLNIAQREAFRFLKHHAARWTQIEDLHIENEPHVRTIVTFVSPDLVRAVILNHMLANFDATQNPNLEYHVQNSMKRLIKNNELVFLMILQSETDEKKIFTIAPQNIILNNTSTTLSQVNISRSDSILNQPLVFTGGFHSGYIYYPIATQRNGNCVPSIDPEKDTNITLTTQKAIIGNTQNVSIHWSFCFCSLLVVDNGIYQPDFITNSPVETFGPSRVPPPYEFNSNDEFYKALSQFIWAKLTDEQIP